MLYKTDYHIHTTFSDGKADPEEYILPAISAGIKEIGFSEHLNLFAPHQEWCMDPARINEYISFIKKLRKSVSGIKIKTGLEVDYSPGMEEEIYRLTVVFLKLGNYKMTRGKIILRSFYFR